MLDQRFLAGVEVLAKLRRPSQADGGFGRVNLPDVHAEQPGGLDQERVATVGGPIANVGRVENGARKERQTQRRQQIIVMNLVAGFTSDEAYDSC